ncbi:Zinc finger protein-like 1 [Lamellibrachia satsuma]|nr:Zinc finger protein-like 1 [Lamellibrachia satsuma]
MGLCKCPKKKVTSLFCFEHRVNVCEHCLVSNHHRCIVQSYLQWLQDSDYEPLCKLCNRSLSDDAAGPCVRLICYDVFHWGCLDHYARQLPANTAPAGYTCPLCKSCIFPANNLVSPVADTLRELLSKVNWARAGLGLPLIEERGGGNDDSASPATASAHTSVHQVPHTYATGTTSQLLQDVVSDESTPYARADKSSDFFSNPRKLFDSTREDCSHLLNMSNDHDDDKYKRRPALQWFARWFKSQGSSGRKDPNAGMKRILIVIVLALIGFLTILLIMSRLGRSAAENDPFLDPMANPNIRVDERQ